MTEGFHTVKKGKIELFVSSGDALLLQLPNNEDCISGACLYQAQSWTASHQCSPSGRWKNLAPIPAASWLDLWVWDHSSYHGQGLHPCSYEDWGWSSPPVYWGHTTAENSLCQFSYQLRELIAWPFKLNVEEPSIMLYPCLHHPCHHQWVQVYQHCCVHSSCQQHPGLCTPSVWQYGKRHHHLGILWQIPLLCLRLRQPDSMLWKRLAPL